jgi:hypothetical protein
MVPRSANPSRRLGRNPKDPLLFPALTCCR